MPRDPHRPLTTMTFGEFLLIWVVCCTLAAAATLAVVVMPVVVLRLMGA